MVTYSLASNFVSLLFNTIYPSLFHSYFFEFNNEILISNQYIIFLYNLYHLCLSFYSLSHFDQYHFPFPFTISFHFIFHDHSYYGYCLLRWLESFTSPIFLLHNSYTYVQFIIIQFSLEFYAVRY